MVRLPTVGSTTVVDVPIERGSVYVSRDPSESWEELIR